MRYWFWLISLILFCECWHLLNKGVTLSIDGTPHTFKIEVSQ